MTTRDEFVNAIRTIKEFCAEKNAFQCVSECPLEGVCGGYFSDCLPKYWEDIGEGGGEDG